MPAPSPLRYTLAVESAARRLLRLTLEVPASILDDPLVLRLPAWSPGCRYTSLNPFSLNPFLIRNWVVIWAPDQLGAAIFGTGPGAIENPGPP